MTNERTENIRPTNRKDPDYLKILSVAWYFVPLLTTAAFIISHFWGHIDIVDSLSVMLAMIGWSVAILTCPLRILKTVLVFLAGGFALGHTICPYYVIDLAVGAFTAVMGALLAVALFAFCPAFFTIGKFIENR